VLVVIPFAVSDHSWALASTHLALRQDGIAASFEQMRDEDHYFRLFEKLWSNGETFTIVEHDIVVWPGAIPQLESCPEPWCTFPYYCSVGWIKDGLGCTKFSAEFIGSHPDFLKEPFPVCCPHTRNYCGLDRLIAHRMNELGMQPHVHAPGVTNLNDKWT
jgi:hypothetical protein